MFPNLQNEKGVTLIEILSSILVLSIILLTFMSVFINASQYNGISSNKMTATNIAREVQEEFTVNGEKNQELTSLIEFSRNSAATTIPKSDYEELDLSQDIQNNSGILTLTLERQKFTVVVDVDTNSDTNVNTSLSKLHVQVKRDTKLLSETFAYFKNEYGGYQ